MHRSKLFRALVIGGSMTAATLVGCGDEKSSNPADTAGQNETSSSDSVNDVSDSSDIADASDASDISDASDTADASDSSDASDAQTELAPCFCSSEPSCCEEVDGEQQVVDGFECCWGTSC